MVVANERIVMSLFKAIDVCDLSVEPFKVFDKKWFVLTVGDEAGSNSMTVSWGAMGTFCGAPAVHIMVRPSRFSYPILEEKGTFTVSQLARPNYDEALMALGRRSGRDYPNKVAEAGLSLVDLGAGAPGLAEAELVIQGEVIYRQDMDPEALPADLREKWFDTGDYHRLYVGKVTGVWVKA